MSIPLPTSFDVNEDAPVPFQLTAVAEATPRTWTFTDRYTDRSYTVTCMLGCTADHTEDIATPTFAGDIRCAVYDRGVRLPITDTATPDHRTALAIQMDVTPFSDTMAEQLPNVTIEFIDEHWIENLGPDELETVINRIQGRVDAMRVAHARLIEVRAEYRSRA